MEDAMEQNQDLDDYRASLLKRLEEGALRSTCGPSDEMRDHPIQVFVNEQRVGWLSGKEAEAVVRFHCQGRVDHVGLRSEDGVLLGGLSAPEQGVRFARVPLRRDSVELSIHNTARGGSVSAVYHPAPDPWRRFVRAMVGASPLRPFETTTVSARVAIVTQVALAIVVLWLAADRFSDWMNGERSSLAVTRAEATKLEQRIDTLARVQAEAVSTVQSQQRGMVELQSAIARLSSAQETVASGMVTVRREIEQRQKKSGRDVERMAELLISQTQMDQQLEAEIRSLTVANERLSKEMAGLVEQNKDLMKRLKATEVDVSKGAMPQQETIMTAQQSNDQSASSDAQAMSQPFLFWVNFNEGTTEEHIDQWVNEMHGRKGAVNEGWQEVQVMHLSVPTERFLEQVKGAKIVRAVRVAR
ncbi:protein of unknown function [Candidatus Nitrospira inopinata]|jgi:hypothetical protein|uniref:Uncharacterized protein n=2 Tax=Candidatus Nitrospira inopinata TaxID=1715989 RepID=A0A0S4KQI0_9BACT|nr:protein of unknown function [Candidatus Nitrospira inopinata]